MRLSSAYVLFSVSHVVIATTLYTLDVDGSDDKYGDLVPFWRSTGYCPPDPHDRAADALLGPDFLHNLAIIGSLPGNQIEQVRIHFLLELVTYDADPDVRFDPGALNFTRLDALLDWMTLNELKPGFELMGNPNRMFSDFENDTQVGDWSALVGALARHCVRRYGLDRVKLWNFESWNEPDYRDFDGLNFTLKGFLNYYDANVHGLRTANEKLRIGGPGERLIEPTTRFKFGWKLIDHCARNASYFNDSVRLDFVSVHNKGDNSSIAVLRKTIDTANLVGSTYPNLARVPIVNNEADPLVGWSKPTSWRGDVTYAAMVAKIICMHQNVLANNSSVNFTYQLHSNDNAFLNYYPHFFEQRTLLARFQMNNSIAPYVQFIRKPVYVATGLLHFLGEKQILNVGFWSDDRSVANTEDVGVLAAQHFPDTPLGRDSYYLTVLIYNSADTIASEEAAIDLTIKLPLSVAGDLKLVKYVMSNAKTNPYEVWKEMGSPKFPSKVQFQRMRRTEEPVRESLSVPFGSVIIDNVTVPCPGITLYHVCGKATLPPGRVSAVRALNVTAGSVLITWQDGRVETTCVKTYEVTRSRSCVQGTYVRINPRDTFYNSFYHTGMNDESVRGCYRVRAVDYWDRVGRFSLPFRYGVRG